jgi:hypothetical protein
MAHSEFCFQVIEKFLTEIGAYVHPDFEPKLNGRAIIVMISPLPRNKRARHPQELNGSGTAQAPPPRPEFNHQPAAVRMEQPAQVEDERPVEGFSNSPFAQLEVKN